MPYPCDYTNHDTNKLYHLTLTEEKGLTKIKALYSPTEWGSVDWEIKDNTFLLHTIQSHPEKGSGLGSLLMHLAAVEARQAGCMKMKILNAAQSERDFYYQMGCTLDTSALADFDQSQFTREEWARLSASCPVVADTSAVVDSSSKSIKKRWT
jgi:hypothetical protein